MNYHLTGEMQTDGVGFVFTTGTPSAGIELDDCRDPDTEALADRAQDIIERIDSYAEVSPRERTSC